MDEIEKILEELEAQVARARDLAEEGASKLAKSFLRDLLGAVKSGIDWIEGQGK